MSKSESATFEKLDQFVNTRLVPFLKEHGFQSVKRKYKIARTQGDYHCFIDYFIEVDKYDQGVVEIGFLAGFKSLCDAWIKIPGVEKPDELTHLGLRGQITDIPPAVEMYYLVDENNSAEAVVERIMHRMSKIVLPFFDEFSNRDHLVDVWNLNHYPHLRGIQGYETQLAAAMLECFGDKERAVELVSRAIADAEAFLNRAKRRVDIVDGRNKLDRLQQALTYVKRWQQE